MKLILLIILLFFAVGLGMALLTRLMRIQQRLGQLQRDLRLSDERLRAQRERIQTMNDEPGESEA